MGMNWSVKGKIMEILRTLRCQTNPSNIQNKSTQSPLKIKNKNLEIVKNILKHRDRLQFFKLKIRAQNNLHKPEIPFHRKKSSQKFCKPRNLDIQSIVNRKNYRFVLKMYTQVPMFSIYLSQQIINRARRINRFNQKILA